MEPTAATAATVVGVGIGLFLLYVVVSGLVVGALARWLLPGPDPMSWPATLGFGIGGSLLGGLVGRVIHLPWIPGLVLSVGGAALLIWYFRRRKTAK
jgi:uncharacterized membrane protein YeaQ/YmgE (transglycosylase-associated protein family)